MPSSLLQFSSKMTQTLETPEKIKIEYFTKSFPLIIENGKRAIKSPAHFDLFTRNILDPKFPGKVITEDFSDYSGYELIVKFNYGSLILPGSGEVVEWSGEIPNFAPWRPPNWPLLTSEDEVKSEELCGRHLETLGLAAKGEQLFSKQMRNAMLASAAVSVPGVRLEDNKSWLIWIMEGYYIDDFFDCLKEHKKDLKATDIFDGVELMAAALEGREIDPRDLVNNPLPRFYSILRMFIVMRRRFLGQGTATQIRHVIDEHVKWIRAGAWQNCGWTKLVGNDGDAGDDFGTYLDLRQYTIAFHLCVEIIVLEQGVFLCDEIRSDPLFKSFVLCLAKFCGFVNDVLSLGKEVDEGDDAENIILIKAKLSKSEHGAGDTLKKILMATIPSLIKRARRYEALLNEKYGEDEMFRKYMYHALAFADSVPQTTVFAKRYSKGVAKGKQDVQIILREWK